MADEAREPPPHDAAEAQALAADARLVRDVRRRLVLWSGGATLLVLLVLAVVLYVAVARSLEARGVRVLEDRVGEIRGLLTRTRPENPDTGFLFGSGTFAMVLDRQGNSVVTEGPGFRVPGGLPSRESIDGADRGGRDVRTARAETVPVRVLTERVELPRRTVFVQVVQDRTSEQRTLDVMLIVLVVGGAVVVVAATGVGAVYARRALVPIRESLANQRIALRRQREFAADASHELRTPLTVVRSSVEYLQRHRDRQVADVGEAIEDIDAEVSHLTALVDDLLLLARSDSGAVSLARAPVDLGDVAADAASALAKPAERKGVRLAVDPGPAVVVGDAARLRQLVLILLDNAIRHTPPGGEVHVRVRPNGRTADLEVSDAGPGVRPEDMPRVFERFWRASGAPSGGTGLGLAIAKWIVDRHGGRIGVAIAKWIVDRHGGRIGVANGSGGGAVFTVHLPLETTSA